MRFAISFILLLLAMPTPAYSQRADRPCSPGGPELGATVGILMDRHTGRKKESSAEAIAEIVPAGMLDYSRVTPLGYIIWDEGATPWIRLLPNSPPSLESLPGRFIVPRKPGTRLQPGIYGVRDREVKLPPGIRLLQCSF